MYMAGRPPTTPSAALRLEILKELQQLEENRELRDRLDKGPISAAKGREHWVLHLLLRAAENQTAHMDYVLGANQVALITHLEELEHRMMRMEDATEHLRQTLEGWSASLEGVIGSKVQSSLLEGASGLGSSVREAVRSALEERLAPVASSVESFAEGSHQVVKLAEDTFRLTSQTRLQVNESAQRVADLGKDLLALEDALRLAVERSIEQGNLLIERRLTEIERRLAALAPPTAPMGTDEPAPEPHGEAPSAPGERSPT
jgi:hypothetical protein